MVATKVCTLLLLKDRVALVRFCSVTGCCRINRAVPVKPFPVPLEDGSTGVVLCFSETGRIRFWRVRLQMPNSVSLFALPEFGGG